MNKSESLISCNLCKSKKSRCGRELPTCSRCLEHGITCTYSNQIKRRGVSEAGLTSFITKINARSSIIPRKRSSVKSSKCTSRDSEKNEIRVRKLILFKPILQPIDYVDESSQTAVAKIQFNNTQKFQTHILIILSTQIIDYDSKLIPQIDSFLGKLKFGIFGGLLKFSIHMDQEWITELFSPSFEEKCITTYFQTFHPMVTYLSKYKFYTNCNVTCPVLKSVMILAGYSSISKKSPKLLKYLKHLAIVQLKKNMFNVKLTVCQAMFIFSHYFLFQGLGKQSLEYFHQAYLMASTLGIHKDIPGLNEMDKDERRCVRYTSYDHDSHLSITISIQPHYLFLTPSWKPLNPLYQTNPHSKDPNEFLIAECICLAKKCFSMYWAISANLMNKYSQLTLTNPRAFSADNSAHIIYVLQTLFNYSLIRALDLHLSLSRKCKNLEELEIVKNFAKIHVGVYHNLILILNSQFSPVNSTLELDRITKKQSWSAQALYRITIDINPLCLPIFYHYLCYISLLYIKLILAYDHIPQAKELLLGKLKQVYELFNNYRSNYNMPSDLIEVVDVITTYHNIKV
ncbi:hypothetical protein CONCODRAFT_12408 [Conidiobolus coronatus NRRL 28638]|uniref:Zn(2)-C6 fungal-type domain-containing protein n=1 Tax=Conidiobolus coronatus (strain ATCC 28846 / CBS 209.66 / NRRL 28638) TaxID=796925 RepID=A0A137NT26_CONC2|nr:hypothetical protein CONCODRAFT_12408 [Conidiobolus coronatus NRRL 28638]|eukprot:KXN65880.1 hypothetical protein CONCODRAFT_12408 [Conidiobolus coronatus NRRL 28638]